MPSAPIDTWPARKQIGSFVERASHKIAFTGNYLETHDVCGQVTKVLPSPVVPVADGPTTAWRLMSGKFFIARPAWRSGLPRW